MTTNTTQFPIIIVSNDTTALRELSWTLSVCGFHSIALSDWGNKTLLQQSNLPSLLLLDARDGEEIQKLLSIPRSAHYTYRIAFHNSLNQCTSEMFMDMGADDAIPFPANPGELQTRVQAALRRLEFEHRLALAMPYETQTGLLARGGFTRRLERKLADRKAESDGVLVVLSIDLLEVIRAEMGNLVSRLSLSALAKCLVEQTINDDFCAVLEEGVFSAFLHQSSVEEGIQYAELVAKEFRAQSIDLPKFGAKPTVSAVVLVVSSEASARELVQRGLTAVGHARRSGGNLILDASELEESYAKWQQQTVSPTPFRSALAQHIMEPLALVLPMAGEGITDHVRRQILDFESHTSLPPFVGVVDENGHLLGVVEPDSFRQQQNEVFSNLAEHLVPFSDVVDSKQPLNELIEVMSRSSHKYLVVLDNDKPVGFVTSEKLSALTRELSELNASSLETENATSLASLVVALN